MQEERIDQVLSALPRDFNDPPPPPLEEMWAVIEAEHFKSRATTSLRSRGLLLAPWLMNFAFGVTYSLI